MGILIGKSPSTIYTLNFPPIMDKIRKELAGWRNLPLSLIGRANLFRMKSFAKILYPLQTIPAMIPTKDIDQLNRSLCEFLLRGQKPRIGMTKLWLHKKEGGINLPNLHLYNLTCLARHSSEWITGQNKYTNTTLEQEMTYPWDLKALLHVPPKLLPFNLKNNLLVRDTVVAWQTIR